MRVSYWPAPKEPPPSIPLDEESQFASEIPGHFPHLVYCKKMIARAIVRSEQRHVMAYVRDVVSRAATSHSFACTQLEQLMQAHMDSLQKVFEHNMASLIARLNRNSDDVSSNQQEQQHTTKNKHAT